MRKVHLPDGTPILIRPIVPEDKALLVQGLSRLSPQSVYRRFMTSLKSLSERQLEYLTEIDYNEHMAWVAADPIEPGHPLLGVARYIRLTGDPTRAEVAVTVLDSHQGRGLGTLLLGRLWRSAVANGVEVFVAYVVGENGRLLRSLSELNASVRFEGQGVFRIELPLPKHLGGIPDSAAGQAFKRIVTQTAILSESMMQPPRAEDCRGNVTRPKPVGRNRGVSTDKYEFHPGCAGLIMRLKAQGPIVCRRSAVESLECCTPLQRRCGTEVRFSRS